MQTLILGDLHHGRKHNVTYGRADIWNYASLEILEQLIKKHDPDQLILAGDVFNSSKPTALSYSELIKVIASVKMVWIIAGNHDISKITEDIAFDNLPFNIVKYKSLDCSSDKVFNFIGWQPTQGIFNAKMRITIEEAMKNSVIVTHCSRLDFGNENDNICTDEHIQLAKAKSITIISGHEHCSSIGSTFSHLGSVAPHSISELGVRYYWFNGSFLEIPSNENIILTREEPLQIEDDKCYYVKAGKDITIEDLKLESKNLNIDVLEDFWKEATKVGFEKGLIYDKEN